MKPELVKEVSMALLAEQSRTLRDLKGIIYLISPETKTDEILAEMQNQKLIEMRDDRYVINVLELIERQGNTK